LFVTFLNSFLDWYGKVLVVFLILMHTKSTEMILHLELSVNLEFFLNQAKNNSPGTLISRLFWSADSRT
jgi:hypothetical protein